MARQFGRWALPVLFLTGVCLAAAGCAQADTTAAGRRQTAAVNAADAENGAPEEIPCLP